MSAVVLDHAHVPGFSGGYVGVDVFFVISGYLISAHLLTSLRFNGTVVLRDFYARRARRILPASLVVLTATTIVAYFVVPPLTLVTELKYAVATALYAPNIALAHAGANYLSNPQPSVYQHYWSLGVEEQFYLVWPLFLLMIGRKGRALKWRVPIAMFAVAVVSYAYCIWQTSNFEPYGFFLPMARTWEFAAGALVAWVQVRHAAAEQPRRQSRVRDLLATCVGWFGLAMVAASVLFFSSGTVFPGAIAALPVLGTAFVIWSGAHCTARLGVKTLLAWGPAVMIGEVSYSLYLVHWPLLQIPSDVVPSGGPWASAHGRWALAAVSLPLAWALYKLVETPGRSWRPLAGGGPARSGIAASIATAAAVALVGALWVVQSHRDLYEDRDATGSVPQRAPVGTSYVPKNLSPSLRQASQDVPDVYRNGCHVEYRGTSAKGCEYGDHSTSRLSVALFGDSHAAEWAPALEYLARTEHLYVAVFTKSACPAEMVTKVQEGAPYAACDRWRDNVIRRLQVASFDVVVIAGYREGNDGVVASSSKFASAWRAGLVSTIRDLASANTQVVNLVDSPSWRFDMPACLSAHVRDADVCWSSKYLMIQDVASQHLDALAAKNAGGRTLSMMPYLCELDECPAIIGNRLVYRDSQHLTASYVAALAPEFGRMLFRICHISPA